LIKHTIKEFKINLDFLKTVIFLGLPPGLDLIYGKSLLNTLFDYADYYKVAVTFHLLADMSWTSKTGQRQTRLHKHNLKRKGQKC